MAKELVHRWFSLWEKGDFSSLPISENFLHESPFGTIKGKKAYIAVVAKNKDKLLGYTFKIHDGIYEVDKACVRYTATQGTNFSLDVSEWYYIKDNLIEKIVAYYHIGEIREERNIENYNTDTHKK